MYRDDVIYENVGSSVRVVGRQQLARFVNWMLAFAPNSKVEFTAVHGDAEAFAAPWVWSGTAAGPLKVDDVVYPAARKHFSVPGVAFCTLGRDGLIASHQDFYDMLAVLKQLGLAAQAVPAG